MLVNIYMASTESGFHFPHSAVYRECLVCLCLVWRGVEVNQVLIRWDGWVYLCNFGLVIIPIIHSPKESVLFVLFRSRVRPSLCPSANISPVSTSREPNILLDNFTPRPVRGAARHMFILYNFVLFRQIHRPSSKPYQVNMQGAVGTLIRVRYI